MNLERRQVALLVGALALVLIAAVVFLIPRSGSDPGSSASPSALVSPGAGSPTPSASARESAGSSPSVSPGVTASPATQPSVTTPPGSAVAPGSLSGAWSGTWVNTAPDQATGSFEVVFVQVGAELSGTITLEGSSCFTGGGIQGTVDGDSVEFQVLQRDEVEFEGTISGNDMEGTFTSSCDSSSGTWTLTKSGG